MCPREGRERDGDGEGARRERTRKDLLGSSEVNERWVWPGHKDCSRAGFDGFGRVLSLA